MEQIQSTQPQQQPQAQVEKRYTIAELKEIGGVSHAFIYRHIQKGTLAKPEKWGRSSRWKESDVRNWLETFQR